MVPKGNVLRVVEAANAKGETVPIFRKGAPGNSDEVVRLILRPQQQKARRHREMVANLRRGDTVVTNGGLIGKVAKVDDNELQVELAEGIRVRIVRGMVAEVRAKGEPVKETG